MGSFAVQIASSAGAHVVAFVSEGDEDYVRSLGADHVLRGGRKDDLAGALRTVAPDGIDGVFDPAQRAADMMSAIKDGGRLVTVSRAAVPPEVRNITATSVGVVPDAGMLAAVLRDVAKDRLTITRIAETVDLADAAYAVRRSQAGLRGKVVLTT